MRAGRVIKIEQIFDDDNLQRYATPTYNILLDMLLDSRYSQQPPRAKRTPCATITLAYYYCILKYASLSGEDITRISFLSLLMPTVTPFHLLMILRRHRTAIMCCTYQGKYCHLSSAPIL